MKLHEIRALVDAATPGPWDALTLRGVIDLSYSPAGHCAGMTWEAADARFIAASRTLVPKLLAVAQATLIYRLTVRCPPPKYCAALRDIDAALRALEASP